MLKLNNFYRKFEDLPQPARLSMIETPIEPTSLLVIFKQLTQVRAQRKYFEEREAHLLALAELGFKQLDNEVDSKTT